MAEISAYTPAKTTSMLASNVVNAARDGDRILFTRKDGLTFLSSNVVMGLKGAQGSKGLKGPKGPNGLPGVSGDPSGAPEAASPFEVVQGTSNIKLVTPYNLSGAYRILTGNVSIKPDALNTPKSVDITFPIGYFTFAPLVFATAISGIPGTGVKGVGVTNNTTSGATLWLTRGDTTSTGLHWVAAAIL